MDEILEVKICDDKMGFALNDVVDVGILDYNRLNNRPSINDVILEGNKTGADLGLIGKPVFDEKVDSLQYQITTETKNRASADNTLTDSLNAEITRAKEQEQALQTAIDSEANDRASADTALSNSISVESTRATNAEAQLRQQVLDEESARKSADNTLQTNIDTEKFDRAKADDEIKASLNSHTSNLSNPHKVVASQVDIADTGNKFTATNVEGALQELASGVSSKVDDVVNADGTSIVDSNKKAQLKNAVVKEAGKVTKSVRFGGSIVGGVTSSVPYDGSKDTSVNMDGDDFVMGGTSSETTQSALYSLKKTGVTAGFYQGITVDEKGRVTAAQDMSYATKQELQEVAAGKKNTFPYDDYQKFVSAVNALASTAMGVGDNVLIKTLNVPDMWVTRVNAVSTLYTYVDDQSIVKSLNTTYGLTVGYFTFSQLETTKVDLTPYQTKQDNGLLTNDKTVVGAVNEVKGSADRVATKAASNAAVIKDIQDGNVAVGEAKKVSNKLAFRGQKNTTEATKNFDGSERVAIAFDGNDFDFDGESLALADKSKYVMTSTGQDISGVKKFTSSQGLMTNAIENLNGNRVYDFDGTNNRFGSFANTTHIRGSESRPKYETNGGSGSTVNKDIALFDDVPTKTSQLTNDSDYATTSQVNAKYTKPSGGIPKNDLASDVQTSLGKADTAVQSDALSAYAKKAELAKVATSGSYNDLQNIPTDIAKVGNLSNPNLLINPNFAINQRGQSEYNQTGYTVDRWTLDAGGTLTPQNDGIKLIGSCRQFFEDLNQLWGKTVALSFKTPSGITSQSATLPAVAPSSNRTLLSTSTDDSGVNAIVRYVNGKLAVVITASTETNIYWAKLEIGSVATEFSPPSIAEELPKCQRYYRKYLGGDSGISLVGEFYAASTTAGFAKIYLGNMRRTPTIAFSNVADIKIGFSTATFESTGVNKIQYNDITKDMSIYKAYITGTGFVAGQAYFLGIAKGGYIDFDAEL